ncbi:MAG: hypothetical protein KIG27_06855, partial [Oscillospiraceae bacterium]|nr:hypothetical protein [Oscillospiraceae bacterium]
NFWNMLTFADIMLFAKRCAKNNASARLIHRIPLSKRGPEPGSALGPASFIPSPTAAFPRQKNDRSRGRFRFLFGFSSAPRR